MHLYMTVVIFFLGLAIASFLNALLYRIDNGYKYPDIFLRGSHCEKCNKQLLWYELIPIFSFLIFKAKCTQCGYKVPLYYPVTEFLLGLSIASIYYFSLPITFYILILFFFVMSYFDRVYKGIPKDIVHIFLLYSFVSFVIYTVVYKEIQDNSILFATIFASFVFFLSKTLKKKFGIGDLLVMFSLGFILSLPFYLSFLYVFLFVSLIYSLILMSIKKATIRTSIPLLPLMFISFSLVLIFEEQLFFILEKILFI